MSTRPRIIRFRARGTPKALATVERAAEVEGKSVSDFVAASSEAAAHRAIAQAELNRAAIEHHEAFNRTVLEPTAARR
jgi:uncharacterized protein (DUF1778 family)